MAIKKASFVLVKNLSNARQVQLRRSDLRPDIYPKD